MRAIPASSSSACPRHRRGRSRGEQPLPSVSYRRHRTSVHDVRALPRRPSLPDPAGAARRCVPGDRRPAPAPRHVARRPHDGLVAVDADVPLAPRTHRVITGHIPTSSGSIPHPPDVGEHGDQTSVRRTRGSVVGAQLAIGAALSRAHPTHHAAECGRRWPGRAMAWPTPVPPTRWPDALSTAKPPPSWPAHSSCLALTSTRRRTRCVERHRHHQRSRAGRQDPARRRVRSPSPLNEGVLRLGTSAQLNDAGAFVACNTGTITYSNLAPGAYVFRVQEKDGARTRLTRRPPKLVLHHPQRAVRGGDRLSTTRRRRRSSSTMLPSWATTKEKLQRAKDARQPSEADLRSTKKKKSSKKLASRPTRAAKWTCQALGRSRTRSAENSCQASQRRIAGVHVGVVEQPEVVGTADVQDLRAGEELAAAAVPALRRVRPDQQVPHHVADGVARRARSGWPPPGGSGRAAAAARPRRDPPRGRARPGTASPGSGRTPPSPAPGPGHATVADAPRDRCAEVRSAEGDDVAHLARAPRRRPHRPPPLPRPASPGRRGSARRARPADRLPASRRRRAAPGRSARRRSRAGAGRCWREASAGSSRGPASISAYVVPVRSRWRWK